METILKIMNLLNSATPGIAQLVLLIRQNDGTLTVVATLDEADKQFDANIATAKAWLESHPKTPTPPASKK